MKSPARYSPEVRERAVRLVLDHQGEHDSQWSAITSVASKLGCTAETLRKWVRQAERDRGVILMRRRFLADLERIARGEDPKAIVRDPAANGRIELPVLGRDYLIDGPTREQLKGTAHPRTRSMLDFVFQAGQPPEVRAAYVEAMGLAPDGNANVRPGTGR